MSDHQQLNCFHHQSEQCHYEGFTAGLWNERSQRRNNRLAYSNCSYSRIGPKDRTPSEQCHYECFTAGLWNERSQRTNNRLAYSNCSYSRIGPKECKLRKEQKSNQDIKWMLWAACTFIGGRGVGTVLMCAFIIRSMSLLLLKGTGGSRVGLVTWIPKKPPPPSRGWHTFKVYWQHFLHFLK